MAPGPVARMYVCGITPYDATHLGHAATYLTFDLVQRVLARRRPRGALRPERHRRRRPAAGAGRGDRRGLGASWPAARPSCSARTWRRCGSCRRRRYVGAVESIPLIVDGDRAAARRRAARTTWTATSTSRSARDQRFGSVSRLDRAADARAVRRARRRPGPAGQEGPARLPAVAGRAPGRAGLGRRRSGRAGPGWHIECTAIALDHLGHVASTSRAAAATWSSRTTRWAPPRRTSLTGQWPFARAYVHAGMVGLDGEKMSQVAAATWSSSRGCASGGVDPMAIRLALLGAPLPHATGSGPTPTWRRPSTGSAAGGDAVAAPAGPPADAGAGRGPRRAGRRPRRPAGARGRRPLGRGAAAPRRRPTAERARPGPHRRRRPARHRALSPRRRVGRQATRSSVAAAQVALELPGDRLAADASGRSAVSRASSSVRTYSAISSSSAASSSTPRSQARASSGRSPSGTRQVEQVLDLAQQCERGLGARRLRDVVRDGGPERHGRKPDLRAGRPAARRRCRSGPRSATARGSSRSASVGVATTVPLTGIGRVCGVSASSAPRVTTSSTPRSVASAEQLVAERAPAHARLDARGPARRRGRGPRPRATETRVVGQVISRGPVLGRPTTCGRLTWKS